MAGKLQIGDAVKKAVIGILLLLLAMVGGLFLLLPSFVDKEAIKNEFTSSFKAATGMELEISGDIVVKSFPVPHVIINSMYVHNSAGGVSSFLLSMKEVEIWPAYTSFLSTRRKVGSVHIDDVDVEIERLKNGQLNWQDPMVQTSAPASFSDLSGKSNLGGTTIKVTNGYIRFLDVASNSTKEYKDISVNFLNGGAKAESNVKLSFSYANKDITVSGKVGNIEQALTVGEMPANLSIASGKSTVKYEGNAGYKNGKFSINGSVRCTTDDVGQWISLMVNDNGHTPDALPGSVASKLLPMDAQSSIATENGLIVFPDLAFKGTVAKGTIRLEIDPAYYMNLKGNVDTLDLESLFASKYFAPPPKVDEEKAMEEGVQGKEPSSKDKDKDSGTVEMPKSLFYSLNMSADVTIGDTIYNDQHIRDAHIESDISEGTMTISQATATLPGEGRMLFAGIGREGFQGFTLEGEVDASGADFLRSISMLKTNGIALPPQDCKRYKLKANITFSASALRVSEIAARIENMGFAGGFIATFGERIKLVGALKIGGINLDHFIDTWGIQEWRASFVDTTPGSQHDSSLARWMKRLDYDTTLNLSFEQFVLSGLPRNMANFKLTATDGRVSIDDLKTDYNGTHLTGGVSLDVKGILPRMNIKLTADTFDADTFFTPDGKLPPAPPQAPGRKADRWSHNEFDFHWLELMNATFHLKFGHYKQGDLSAQDLDLQGTVEERNFSIDSISGIVLGARMAGKFNIRGGKIPAISFQANITSLEAAQLVPFLPVLNGMTGKYNISLRLDTSGIDMYSWISSLQGTVGLGGSRVNVHGFNLGGVIHAVSYVRTVADILNVVKRAFPGGDTTFSNIEGQWTVSNGVFKTSGARLVNDQSIGTLTSEIDLVDWKMQSVINLALTALDAAHPPSISISCDGNLDHPDIALDTRLLEQFVTNRTSEQMLQQYGTGNH